MCGALLRLRFANYACGYTAGRSKDDPVYVSITEGRDGPKPEHRAGYSSCGDLAHWLYMRLGIRAPWLNRTDDDSFGPWRPGQNITRLWGTACPFDQEPPNDPNWSPEAGDVVLIWNTGVDAHVMVSLGRDGAALRTANYGAGGMSPLAFPGAKLASKPITPPSRQAVLRHAPDPTLSAAGARRTAHHGEAEPRRRQADGRALRRHRARLERGESLDGEAEPREISSEAAFSCNYNLATTDSCGGIPPVSALRSHSLRIGEIADRPRLLSSCL